VIIKRGKGKLINRGRTPRTEVWFGGRITGYEAVKEPATRVTCASDVIFTFFEPIVGPHPEVPHAMVLARNI
jgi:hypothetical protein